MDAIEDLWDALREGDTGNALFWAAVGVLVLIAVILLCTVRCCIWCRQRRTQRMFNKERNDSLDPDELWEGQGRTRPVKESYPGDNQGTELQVPLKARHFREAYGVVSPQASHSRHGSQPSVATRSHNGSHRGSRHGHAPSNGSSHSNHGPAVVTLPGGNAPGGFAPINYAAADPFTGHDYSLSLPHSPAGSPHMQQYPPMHMNRSSPEKVEIQPAQAPWGPQHVQLSPQASDVPPGTPGGRGAANGVVEERQGSSPADMTAVSASTSSAHPHGASPPGHTRSPSDPQASPAGDRPAGQAAGATRSRRGQGGTRKQFADRLQPPLPVSPRPAQLAASVAASVDDSTAATADPSAVFRSPVGDPAQHGGAGMTMGRRTPTSREQRRRRQGPPAYLRMDERPISIDGKSAAGISQSQGIPLEADINLAGAASSSFYGSVDGIGLDSGGGGAHARRGGEETVQRKMAREYTASVAQEGVALTQHLGLSMQRHANPKIIEPEAASPADAAAAAAASAMRLWDTGARFWRLWRRSESHYAVIRRLHNLPVSGAARFTKQAIDLDMEEAAGCHPALDTVMTVAGAEEVVYVDIAVQCGLYLEVLLPAVLGAPERWVRVVLLEGSVALMPKGISYRLCMPAKGIVGLIRARMPSR